MDRGAWWATVQRVSKRARNDLLTKQQQLKVKTSIWKCMNFIHSFIHSTHTHREGNHTPGSSLGIRVQGPQIFFTSIKHFRTSCFLMNRLYFPVFTPSFLTPLHSQERLGSQKEAHINLNPWEKQVSLPDTKTGSNECAVITHCSTFHISFSSRNIKWFFPSHRPHSPAPPHPKTSDLTVLSSPGTGWPHRTDMSSVFHFGSVVHWRKICQVLKVYLASVLVTEVTNCPIECIIWLKSSKVSKCLLEHCVTTGVRELDRIILDLWCPSPFHKQELHLFLSGFCDFSPSEPSS